MDNQQHKKFKLQARSQYQNLTLHPQFTQQRKKIIQIEQILSKYKEILRKIIRKVKLLGQTNYHQWDKLQSQVNKKFQGYHSQSISLVRQMHYMSFIDVETTSKLTNQAILLSCRFGKLEFYVFSVKKVIASPSLSKIYELQNKRMVWEDSVIKMQEDYIVEQEQNKKEISYEVENTISDEKRAEKNGKYDL